MTDISAWSSTAALNTSAPPDGFPEAMAPSAVNNAAREVMAAVRRQMEEAEWFNWGHVPIYQGVQSFLVSSTATQIYTYKRRLKMIDAGVTIYGSVITATPSGANTVVSISSSNISASFSSVAISILNPALRSYPLNINDDNGTVSPSGTSTLLAYPIPAGCKRVIVNFHSVSTNGTSEIQLQIGSVAGLETAGYRSAAMLVQAATPVNQSSTTGFVVVGQCSAAAEHSGIVILSLENPAQNIWVASGNLAVVSSMVAVNVSAGEKTLAGALDRVYVTTVGGANSFDAGEIHVTYEL